MDDIDITAASGGEERAAAVKRPIQDTQAIDAERARLRRMHVVAKRENDGIVVDTRYLMIADTLVSVRVVSAQGDEAVGKIADALIASIKPARD